MTYLIETMANTAAGNRDGMDTEWLDALANDTDITVTIGNDTVRYEWDDGSSVVEAHGAWDFGIHRSWFDDTDAMYAVTMDRHCKDPEYAWPNAIVYLDEKHMFPNARARIDGVVACWQRNLMVRGNGVKAKPVDDARVIIGMEGDLHDMAQLAQTHADDSLVAVSIYTLDDDEELYLITPTR